jgi:hypothetical protein
MATLPHAYSSCIPALPVWTHDASGGEKLKNFRFDSNVDLLAEVEEFVKEAGKDLNFKMMVLEALVKHAASFSGSRDIDNGEIFLRLDWSESFLAARDKVRTIATIVTALPTTALPARVWSTASSPPFQIVIDSEEFMGQQIMNPEGYWLYDQVTIVTSSTRSSKGHSGVFIDIGANLGMVALFAAAVGEDVVAFEATSRTAQRLKASCVINGWCPLISDPFTVNSFNNNNRFAIFENAVSNIDGEDISMRVDWHSLGNVTNGGANSMFKVDNENDSMCRFESAISITVDTALVSLGLLPEIGVAGDFKPAKHISMMKMDCEGCEPLALLGASRLFQYNPPMSMLVEVNEERLRAGGVKAYDFLIQIEKLGYDLVVSETAMPISPVTEQIVLDELNRDDSRSFDVMAISKSALWDFGMGR